MNISVVEVMKDKNKYSLFRDGEWIASGTFEELSKETGMHIEKIRKFRHSKKKDTRTRIIVELEGEKKGRKKVYAYYKGDQFLMSGTAEEIATYDGVKPNSIHSHINYTKRERKKKYYIYTLEEI